jgi:MerR family transcriptional regulator, light-induced transcriptional regulator
MDQSRFRIGVFRRRVGVAPERLRAWERRYGLFEPRRSEGGFRLYSTEDERRALRMKELLAAGLSAAEAAREAAGPAAEAPMQPAPARAPMLDELSGRLSSALESFDGPAAHAALDDLLAAFDVDTVVSQVVIPYLNHLGACWARGDVSVAQEHFASRLLHGRLLALARGWERGPGPLAVVACPPGEEHDIGPIAFGLALHRRGWRITFLGANTPVASVLEVVTRLEPALVVLAATVPSRFEAPEEELGRLAGECRLALAGAGAQDDLATRIGAELFAEDPVGAADRAAAS